MVEFEIILLAMFQNLIKFKMIGWIDLKDNRSIRRKHKKKTKRKWIFLTPLILLALIIGFIAIYAANVLSDVKESVNKNMYESVSTDVIDSENTKNKIARKDNINVLLLGIDSDSDTTGRSDAIIVMSLKPKQEKIQLVSIPRDTRTTIVGRGTEDKINHAYAFGGSDMTIATVEKLLEIEIDYFARVNMDGLKEVVDLVGPISINNHLAFSQGGDSFATGDINLTGSQAMNYVQMRKEDPNGDFGRTERQRKVIEGIVRSGAKIKNVTRIAEMIDVLGNNVSTNMQFEDMTNLFNNYRRTINNFENYQVQGKGTMINNIYYLNVSDEEINKVHQLIES